jgi:hypothetical protein
MCDYKVYTCRHCGLILGVIMRGSSRQPKLNVLRNGANPDAFHLLGDVNKINYAVRNMDQGTVVCSVCGSQREYHVSEQAMDEMLERRARRNYGLTDVV